MSASDPKKEEERAWVQSIPTEHSVVVGDSRGTSTEPARNGRQIPFTTTSATASPLPPPGTTAGDHHRAVTQASVAAPEPAADPRTGIATGTSCAGMGNEQISVETPDQSSVLVLQQQQPTAVARTITTPPSGTIRSQPTSFASTAATLAASPTAAPSSAAQPSLNVATFDNSVPSEEAEFADTINQQRAPLVEKFAPFIAPSDRSLQDARQRLITALEQVRALRSAFTERVYGKYRVCLRPPEPAEDVLQRIRSDPKAVCRQVEMETRQLKEEKELEKKEAQALNAELNATGDPAFLQQMNADNADQLMYISAGLSLVILPEERMDPSLQEIYEERAPVHPVTGQRVRSISLAAASAGEIMLDRARKAAAMRVERLRRRGPQITATEASPATPTGVFATSGEHHLLLSTTAAAAAAAAATTRANQLAPPGTIATTAPNTPSKRAGGATALHVEDVAKASTATTTTINTSSRTTVPTTFPGVGSAEPNDLQPVLPLRATTAFSKALKRSNSGRSVTSQTAAPPASAASSVSTTTAAVAAAKGNNRARASNGIPTNILLSLHPSADELQMDKIQRRASTAALHDRAVGYTLGSAATRTSPQQRLRHPFPPSMGGRQRATSGASKRDLTTFVASTLGAASPALQPYQQPPPSSAFFNSFLTLSLPPLPTPTERKLVKPLAVLELDQGGIAGDEVSSSRAQHAIQSALKLLLVSNQSGRPTLAKKIDLMQEVHMRNCARASSPTIAEINGGRKSAPEENRQRPIDPSLAFSVLQAVGLITEKVAESKLEAVDQRMSKLMPTDAKKLPALTPMKATWLKISSSNKRTFSEAFDENKKFTSETPASRSTGITDSPPVASIRGGGERLSEATDDNNSGIAQAAAPGSAESQNAPPRANSNPGHVNRQPQNNLGHEPNVARFRWDDPSHQSLAMFNAAHLGRNPASLVASHSNQSAAVAAAVRFQQNQRHQQQQSAADAFRHQSTLNALHLAQQLRNSNALAGINAHGTQSNAELAGSGFIGGMQHSAQWPSLGTATAAIAAQNSLAALGLSVPIGVYSAVHDRAARSLLAREQQHVAATHAVSNHQQALSHSSFLSGAANPGFPPATSSVPRSTNTHHGASLRNSTPPMMMPPSTPQAHAAAPAVRHPVLGMTSHVQDSRPRMAVAGSSVSNAPQQRTNNPLAEQSKGSAGQQLFSGGASEPRGSAEDCVETLNETARKPSATAIEDKRQMLSSNARVVASTSEAASQPTNKLSNYSNERHSQQTAETQTIAMTITGQENPSGPLGGSSSRFPKELVPAQKSGATTKPGPADAHEQVRGSATLATSRTDSGGTMKFFLPPAPPSLSWSEVGLVRSARIHEVLANQTGRTLLPNAGAMVEYVIGAGGAVPIPKALISASLKERLASSGFKQLASNAGVILPREVVSAVVLLWLWNNHEESFQQAFAKRGRIDVDPTCRSLIQAAVDASVRALIVNIGELARFKGMRPSKSDAAGKGAQKNDSECPAESSTALELRVASVVSKALMADSFINSGVDSVLPHFHSLVKFLGDCRICALQSRSQERVLLASLVSVKANMSESFSFSYVSSMVRAGDALGHDKLADIVLDEDAMISSMLPYDIFKDATGVWEDPCRPTDGFSQKVTGDVLTKTAHARAMIQKSLRKLQDRHSIKGGIPHPGPYTDLGNVQSQAGTVGAGGSIVNAGAVTPSQRSGQKRRATSFTERPIPVGTGSAQPTSWAMYDPQHFSAPLVWDVDGTENAAYGKHDTKRPRLTSLVHAGRDQKSKDGSINQLKSLPSASNPMCPDASDATGSFMRSTWEVDWAEVAGSFRPVKHTKDPSSQPSANIPPAAIPTKTIVSPFCRYVDGLPLQAGDESDDEEDLSDTAILARHQVVLDEMKEKLSNFMEMRRKLQDRRKSRLKDKT